MVTSATATTAEASEGITTAKLTKNVSPCSWVPSLTQDTEHLDHGDHASKAASFVIKTLAKLRAASELKSSTSASYLKALMMRGLKLDSLSPIPVTRFLIYCQNTLAETQGFQECKSIQSEGGGGARKTIKVVFE